MFFRRQPKNRRLGREHVLDVKLRSSQVRAVRTRVAVIIVGGVCAVLFSGYLLYRAGSWALDRLFYENTSFAIHELELQTDGVIASEQLRSWANVSPGQNLLALDLARVKHNLEVVPFIDSVSVERILPHALRIRVTEREPVAQINLPRMRPSGLLETAPCFLDADACVMPPLDPRARAVPPSPGSEQLPVISGFKTEGVQPGRPLDSSQVRAALRLIQTFERSQMGSILDLKRVDVSAPDVLVATTSQNTEITFSAADVDQQLRRWHEIYDMGQRLGKAVSTLDLAVSNNIPAKWLEASAVPATPPKLPRTFRTKKRHV